MKSGKMESNPIDQVTNDGIIYIIKTLEKASLLHTLATSAEIIQLQTKTSTTLIQHDKRRGCKRATNHFFLAMNRPHRCSPDELLISFAFHPPTISL